MERSQSLEQAVARSLGGSKIVILEEDGRVVCGIVVFFSVERSGLRGRSSVEICVKIRWFLRGEVWVCSCGFNGAGKKVYLGRWEGRSGWRSLWLSKSSGARRFCWCHVLAPARGTRRRGWPCGESGAQRSRSQLRPLSAPPELPSTSASLILVGPPRPLPLPPSPIGKRHAGILLSAF